MLRVPAFKRNRIAAAAVSVLLLLAACNSTPAQPFSTPDATMRAIQAATGIAEVATSNALTATPTPTETPVPTSTPTPTATPVPPTPTDVPTTPTPVPGADYTVHTGDTLLSIAQDHMVSMAAILLKNDLDNTAVITVNQVLKMPAGLTWPDENVYWSLYIVRAGDTLSQIAQRNNVSLGDVTRINQIDNPAAILVGQKLVLPVTSPDAVRESVSSADVAGPGAPTPAPVAAHVAGSEDIRSQLLVLYNQARTSRGLAPLKASTALLNAAQLHAQDCSDHGVCSHYGSDGSSASARIALAGYSGHITGENWVMAQDANEAFDIWYNQEPDNGPHRTNILSERYAEVNFGIAGGSDRYLYIIADFGAP